MLFFFFFSSRRRHTRCSRDWSSDVCSSDLSPYFGEYPPDFFDFIVIDECHRGGANDESNWRGILDYFAPAVQLGLTATPRRRDNVDTRSEEHTSELQSRLHLVCRLLLEKKKTNPISNATT